MRRAAWLCAPLAAAIAGAAPDARTREKTRYVVAAIGDSLTDEKVGGGKYLEVLRERCPESVFLARGKGGEMVNQMKKRLPGALFGAGMPRLDHVIVLGGVNDLYSDQTAGRTPEKVERDLSAMYREARLRGAKIVAVTVAPWGGFKRYWSEKRQRDTDALNEWIRGQKAGGAVDHVVDAADVLKGEPRERLCDGCGQKDGLHWTKAGHQRLGAALHAAVFSDCR
ncbi:MAG: SGNH/GDSL hydrolase family protein [Polyangiaceae bacterium]|nr:SGNH/GDSL hydrolase family protein [Polyangiaceae bacterium]